MRGKKSSKRCRGSIENGDLKGNSNDAATDKEYVEEDI